MSLELLLIVWSSEIAVPILYVISFIALIASIFLIKNDKSYWKLKGKILNISLKYVISGRELMHTLTIYLLSIFIYLKSISSNTSGKKSISSILSPPYLYSHIRYFLKLFYHISY